MSDIEKALAVFQGISSRDPVLATKYMDPKHYVEHNPHARDGVEGVKLYVEQIAADHPELKVIRAYQDGSYVFTQTDGLVLGDGTFFDAQESPHFTRLQPAAGLRLIVASPLRSAA